MNNTTLLHLDLDQNRIEGAEGGRQVGLLLQRCPKLKVLNLERSNLGPLGARAMSLGLAAASHLESLNLQHCNIRNDGVKDLVPEGHVNTSLTWLNLVWNGLVGGVENVIALVERCTNLDHIDVVREILNPDQQRRLDLLMDRKRLCTMAQTLAGSAFPVLFQFVEEQAHGHEYGPSAIFVILRNDGDDYFYNAFNNRAIP